MVTLSVLSYNHWELTHRLLFNLYKHCTGYDEVIVIDNGSTEKEVLGGLNFWLKADLLPIRVVRIQENKGFSYAANKGITRARGDIVFVLSNDLEITQDVIPSFVKAVEETKGLVGHTLYDYDTGWNKFGETLYPYLGGYILGAYKSTWVDIGGFDMRYSPYDYEDIDLSTKAISKGYSLTPVPVSGLVHLGGKTINYSPEREQITKRNRDKFAEKWGAQVKLEVA